LRGSCYTRKKKKSREGEKHQLTERGTVSNPGRKKKRARIEERVTSPPKAARKMRVGNPRDRSQKKTT